MNLTGTKRETFFLGQEENSIIQSIYLSMHVCCPSPIAHQMVMIIHGGEEDEGDTQYEL